MKKIAFITFIFFILPHTNLIAQKNSPVRDNILVLFENDKMKVTKYVSNPGKDVCGKGTHSHRPHLDIPFTDITGVEIGKDGKPVKFTEKAGAVYWNEAVTHIALNKGDKPVILYIVEPK
ncbi:MAG: hypothetical protein ABIQ07_04010 [Ginsengibacter sp.]